MTTELIDEIKKRSSANSTTFSQPIFNAWYDWYKNNIEPPNSEYYHDLYDLLYISYLSFQSGMVLIPKAEYIEKLKYIVKKLNRKSK